MPNQPQIPDQLLNSLKHAEGFDKKAFIQAHSDDRVTSVRFNPFKKTVPEFTLGAPVPWSAHGCYVDSRPSFTRDPLFQAGCYYVQEPGSMFIEYALTQVLDTRKPLKILDACAAPGGKSTLINSLLSTDSLLVANEFVKSRVGVLTNNLGKWGTHNTVVTNNDLAKFSTLNGVFDAVVVDAPCSGSGLFRKQPDAIDQWTAQLVQTCCTRQKKIIADIYPALQQDGILVYSTCSYSYEENEDIVGWMLEEFDLEQVALEIPSSWGVVVTARGYRFYPHLTRSEGFFCAVLRKRGEEDRHHLKAVSTSLSREKAALIAPLMQGAEGLTIEKNNQFHWMNGVAAAFLTKFEKHLYFKKAGTVIGEIKGKSLVPNHEAALSIYLSNAFQRVELGIDGAISYLKKEPFAVPENRTGWVLFTYHNFGIGWGKVLQNRVNNYLPADCRILM